MVKKLLKKRPYILIAAIIVVLLAIIGGLGLIQNNNGKPKFTATVVITSNGFEPSTLQVAPRTQVTWVNSDAAPHQIASNPYPEDNDVPGLKSGVIQPKQVYSYMFTGSGNFGYHDELHPTTEGMIIVK